MEFYFIPGESLHYLSISNSTSASARSIRGQYKVVVEIEEFLLLKDALVRAIDAFNYEGSNTDFKIANEISKYTLRLAKKNGKPNYDVPCLLCENSIKSCKIERVAVILEADHISGRSCKSSNTELLRQESSLTDPLNVPVKPKKCCQSCLII